ncbi:MAG: glycosyltransferase family 4 protein [Candidatus Pacebacteria bacterium]|nr:glycosyltransferase family 4 protein [Candidatus Paceibacterota bacterium]
MKILTMNTSDIQGGAARAAYRLHRALLDSNIDSQMLVQSKKSEDHTVLGPETKVQKAMAKSRSIEQLIVSFYGNKAKNLFSPAWSPFSITVKKINEIDPDIVHLHWITGGMIGIEALAKIKAPIVWSLHDMWALTGGCYYDENCGAYKNSCGNCKILGSNKNNDLSRKIFERKQKTFSKINNLTVVGLSSWLEKCAKESSLFKNRKILNLPNPINTNIFKITDKYVARKILNLPNNKKLVLFGTANITSDPRKGFDKLSEALKKIKNENIELVMFGGSESQNMPKLRYKIHWMGYQSDLSLQSLYCACDLTVVPSLQENLSNTIMESLSCATPVVGFDIGGNSDMIEHKKNGYLAKPFNTNDLANGIEWVVNCDSYDELCKNARKKVLEEFDSKVVARKYINLYKETLRV